MGVPRRMIAPQPRTHECSPGRFFSHLHPRVGNLSMWGEPVSLQNTTFGEQKQISSVISIEIE
jgi:hypothetical protein